jgi:hypothetical protein
MSGTIKIDLHTHPLQAVREKMKIQGILDIKREVAQLIVKTVEQSGLDGIAIIEQNNFNWAWVTSLEIMNSFANLNLIVLPGAEITFREQHYLRIYVPEQVRRRFPFFNDKEWFSVLAHPGFYHPLQPAQVAGIHFDCVEGASRLGQFEVGRQIAINAGVPLIETSDAYRLEDIGSKFIELEPKAKGFGKVS